MSAKPRLSRLWLAVGAALWLAGCVSPPKEAEHIRKLDEAQLGLIQHQSVAIHDGWWKAFGDEQLNRLIEDALANNPNLGEALVRVRVAQAQAVAAGAALRPGFSLNGEETRERLSENSTIPPKEAGFPIAGGDIVWNGQLTANMAWDLDFWGRHADLLQQAKQQMVATALDTFTSRLALSGAMAQAYVDLFRAYALLDIAQENEQQRESLLKLTQNRVKAGLDSQVELRLAEAALPQAHNARLQAQLQRDLAVHSLAALTGHGAEIYDSIGRPALNLHAALPLPTELTLDLLSRRPDILAAKARVDAASAGKSAADAAFYPNINLSAFAGFQAIGLDNLFKSGSAIYGVGPAVHLPLFDSKRLKAGYWGASAELDGAIASYNDTVLKAVRDVADQLSKLQSLNLQMLETQRSLAATESAFKLAQSRYAAGLISQVALLNAEAQLLNARRDQVSLATQLVITRVTLLLMFGGSFDPNSNLVTAQESHHE